jgi:hypothetical protein
MPKKGGQRNVVRLSADRRSPVSSPRKILKNSGTSENIDATLLLQQIQKKVTNSTVLNDGFDVLLFKIEKIEESQERLVGTVDSIHNAIYHPDDGLFSRISAVKLDDINGIEKKIQSLDSWKESQQRANDQFVSTEKEIIKKVDDQRVEIEKIEGWRKNVNAVGKWFLVALGGGVVTLIFKALTDAIF